MVDKYTNVDIFNSSEKRVRMQIDELMKIAEAFHKIGNEALSLKLYHIARDISYGIADMNACVKRELKEEMSGCKVLGLKQALDSFEKDLQDNPIQTPGR